MKPALTDLVWHVVVEFLYDRVHPVDKQDHILRLRDALALPLQIGRHMG